MGYEYNVELKKEISPNTREEIITQLSSHSEWQLLNRKNNELSFAFSNLLQKNEWHEDVIIEIYENSIYLVFHSGIGGTGEKFLEFLKHLLKSYEFSFYLAEL